MPSTPREHKSTAFQEIKGGVEENEAKDAHHFEAKVAVLSTQLDDFIEMFKRTHPNGHCPVLSWHTSWSNTMRELKVKSKK